MLLEASWISTSRSQQILQTVIESLNEINPIPTIIDDILFVLRSKGRDEIENFIVEIVGANDLPCLALFRGSGSSTLLSPVWLHYPTTDIVVNQLPFKDLTNLLSKPFHPLVSLQVPPVTISLECAHANGNTLRLFVSGDRSSVGKSTVCLGILTALLREGVPATQLRYIKPVTQCELEQPITRFCQHIGIRERSIGPVVFYKGFTRAFLAGETESSHTLLEKVAQAVIDISHDALFTLIDGVGYPSVGSICSLSNAHVAAALNAPVLLVGKSGVGDAVDSHNLNSAFFENHGVTVIGAIFNKLSADRNDFYNIESCAESVNTYFKQYLQKQRVFGFLPLLSNIDVKQKGSDTIDSALEAAGPGMSAFAASFYERIDIKTLLYEATKCNVRKLKSTLILFIKYIFKYYLHLDSVPCSSDPFLCSEF